MSIVRPIAEHARRLPDEIALIFEGHTTPRRELDQAVARLAACIAARTPGNSAVALDLPTSPALAVLFLATAGAGRIAQVLDRGWPAETARSVLVNPAPALVFTDRADLVPGALSLSADTLVAELAGAVGAPKEARRLPDPDAELDFYIGYTSGSTGAPKGFVRTHRSWTASFAGAQQEFGIGPADCVFSPGPLSHSLPLYALASSLHAGARFVFGRAFQARSALRTLLDQRVSVIYAVPAQLVMLIEAAEAEEAVCRSVRLVLSTGAKWPQSLSARFRKVFPGAVFAEFYGASELSFVTLARSDQRLPKGSVGRAFPGVSISIRSPSGKKQPAGRSGLVFVESPLVFSGYTHGAQDVLRVGKAISVGDRGYLDRAGFLYLTGRNDRLVISSGRNIQPEEVEAVLARHPALAACAVFGLREEKRSQRLVALIRFKADKSAAAADLVAHLRKVLPAYKVPSRFVVAKQWPVTPGGKTDHARLDAAWNEGEALR